MEVFVWYDVYSELEQMPPVIASKTRIVTEKYQESCETRKTKYQTGYYRPHQASELLLSRWVKETFQLYWVS